MKYKNYVIKKAPLVFRAVSITILLLLPITSHASETSYPNNIERWQEVHVPLESNKIDWILWYYASNYSEYEWNVHMKNNQLQMQLLNKTAKAPEYSTRPSFTPKVDKFGEVATAFQKVDDGWLIAFNRGEFGAALYWFSIEGNNSYLISDRFQVVSFYSKSNHIYAIEGLAHLGISRGSIIRLARAKSDHRWRAIRTIELPEAPYAASVQNNGNVLIVLSDSLVEIDSANRVQSLIQHAPWSGLYPNSSALSANNEKLYIGMRQYVGEFNLKNKRLRFLIPTERYLNKLPKDVEDRLRKQYNQ